jgi:hypothetical protein
MVNIDMSSIIFESNPSFGNIPLLIDVHGYGRLPYNGKSLPSSSSSSNSTSNDVGLVIPPLSECWQALKKNDTCWYVCGIRSELVCLYEVR